MAFSSNFFLFAFLPATLLVYFAAPVAWRNPVLLLVSLLFYAFDSGWLAWILVASILCNYLVARSLTTLRGPARHLVFAGGVALNLAPLLHFKYTGFLWSIAAPALDWAGLAIGPAPHVALPIGISFFTFQAISYLADVYAGEVAPAPRLVDFGAYHALFPQLIAGPIVRYVEVERAILSARRWSLERSADGLFRFCLGLGKKIILADNMGAIVDPIFALPPSELTGPLAWLAVVAYTLQIYFDFSGYSDMAIGLGQILGFDFPENFNQPYRSRSVTEFWRRWHMTLSRWFRDYLYIPLGGNREGPWRTARNLFAVFFLCGLWHGAGYTFVAWGLYHGALLSAERVYRHWRGAPPGGAFGWAYALLAVMVGWVLFRSSSIAQAGDFLAALSGVSQASVSYFGLFHFLTVEKAFYLAWAIFFALWPFERVAPRLGSTLRGAAARAACALVVFLYAVTLLSANSFNPFIYFRF
jgi:alginate O-acetyltransferase complex protein AlgI